jgi:hypothetical protein
MGVIYNGKVNTNNLKLFWDPANPISWPGKSSETLLGASPDQRTIDSSSPNSGGYYTSIHAGLGLTIGDIPRYSIIKLEYEVIRSDALTSGGDRIISGNMPGTHFGPGDVIDANTSYGYFDFTLGKKVYYLVADGDDWSSTTGRTSMYLRTNNAAVASGAITFGKRAIYLVNRVFDISGNGITGTSSGMVHYNPANKGVFDTTISVSSRGSGNGKWISNTKCNEIFPTGVGTICLWIKPESTARQTLVSGYKSGDTYRWDFEIQSGQLTGGSHDVGFASASDLPLTLSEWAHVCIRNDGSNFNFFVNGVKSSQSSSSSGEGFQSNVELGLHARAEQLNDFPYLGETGPLMVYNVALTDDEVLENYKAHRARFGVY